MINVLILDQNNRIARLVARDLQELDGFNVTRLTSINFEHARGYIKALRHQNVIASFLGPMDVDLDFEALFDAISQVMPPLHQLVMLSHAGINNEVTGSIRFSGINNVSEYLNEQRYAAKVVDESELPYTILRPVTITSQPATMSPKIIEEGHSVPNGMVSYQNVARVADNVIANHCYINQSVAIIDQK